MNDVKRYEFKINIEECPKEHIHGLILGLIYSGYSAYFDYENKHICFVGWSDEIIGDEINDKS